jgi:hypothetical protein
MLPQWEYREQAEECEARANRFDDERETWLDQAQRWRELASMIEKERRAKDQDAWRPQNALTRLTRRLL